MLFVLASFAVAWAGDTHKAVTQAALTLLKTDKPEVYKFFTTTHADDMDEFNTGTTDPDILEFGPGTHYYNYPGEGENTGQYYEGGSTSLTPGTTARTRLEDHLDKAYTKYCEGKYNKAMKQLGRAVHYIEDIGCPPHSSDIQYPLIGTNHHKMFEKYIDSACAGFSVETDPKVYQYFAEKELGWILNNLAKESYAYKDDVLSESEARYDSAGRKAFTLTAQYVAAFLNEFYENRNGCSA